MCAVNLTQGPRRGSPVSRGPVRRRFCARWLSILFSTSLWALPWPGQSLLALRRNASSWPYLRPGEFYPHIYNHFVPPWLYTSPPAISFPSPKLPMCYLGCGDTSTHSCRLAPPHCCRHQDLFLVAQLAMPSLFPERLCCHPGPPCLLPCLFPVLLDDLPHPTAVHVALSRHTSPCRCGTPDAWHRAWHMLDTLCIQAKHVNKQMNNGFPLSVSTQPWEGEEGSIYL